VRGGMAVPALDMTLKLTGLQDAPRSLPVMQAYDRMTTAFPSTGFGHLVVVQAPPAQATQVRAALNDLASRVTSDPLFAHDAQPEVAVSPNGTVSLLKIGTPHAVGTEGATQSLDRLRDDLLPASMAQLTDVEYAVTGEIAGTLITRPRHGEAADRGRRESTFLVMAWTFRSLVVAATAIVLNMLSVGAAYGVLVLVFQNTWAEGLLDFRSNQGIISWLPLFLFVVLFGLSMDYHVFVVSRIREAVRGGVPNRDAVALGITCSAGVVTSAAVVMVGVFAILRR
jgi:RND superfamily putative drug exporter